MAMDRLAQIWPLFGLRLRCGPVELRLPRDEDLADLADLAAAGIHPPEQMPFYTAWTRERPPGFQRSFVRHHWGSRSRWAPEHWSLDLAVRRAGVLVGVQSVEARAFAVRRVVDTGSWLGMAHQGRGTGTLMRVAVLALAFDHLGAREATSGAFLDNPASLAVSAKLGYRDNGVIVHDREGVAAREQLLVLSAQDWRAVPRPAVDVEGVEDCRALLGGVS